MEPIIAAQQEAFGRIARTLENLKKAGTARISGPLIATTLKLLDSKWAKFEEHHERLRSRHWDELKGHEYYLQDFYGKVECAYAQQRAALLEMEKSLSVRQEGEQEAVQPAPPRTTLPRIQLPSFSGRYEDWPAFRDLFRSLIVNDPSISDVTRLHYLKTSLKGEAEALVRSLPTTEANFSRAWTSLLDFYENTRLLVRSYYAAYTALPKMKTESAADLRKLFHAMTSTVGSLESVGRPITSSEDLFVFLTVEMLDSRSRREWENAVGGTAEPPTYDELRQFIERRLHTLDAMQPSKVETAKSARTHHVKKETPGDQPKRTKERCTLCRKDHFLMMCEVFRGKAAVERRRFVEDTRLCCNCLGKHQVGECKSKRNCSVCEGRHHSTLHDAYALTVSAAAPSDVRTSHIARHEVEERVAVLLATVRINVRDQHGGLHAVRALIDQGSEVSIVTETLVQRLRLPRTRAPVTIFGVGGQQTGVARGRVQLAVSSRKQDCPLSVSALVLPRLTVYAGVDSVAVRDWPHLRGIDLADPDFAAADRIDVLLGAEVYAAIIGPGVRRGGAREPIAQQTSLGWIVSGAVDTSASRPIVVQHCCSADDSLNALVQRFWTQEEVGGPCAAMTDAEKECEDYFVRTVSRGPEGRYTVRLPLTKPFPDLSGTRELATRMLVRVERGLSRNVRMAELYREFMREYERLGHMSRADTEVDASEGQCYLPHHGVLKEASATTKLRVVFNGSATVQGGASLNRGLLVGPNLLPSLADVLLRWRWHRYVVAADVEKMYRQILVHPDDRDLQRILWSSEPGVVREYRLNTVTYGLACSPFLAIRTLRQLADDEEKNYPRGAQALRRDVYVDDVLSGAEDKEETRRLLLELRRLCMAGGFPLKKWASNDADLLDALPVEELSRPGVRSWLPHDSHSALGLLWHPNDDAFGFSARIIVPTRLTKRSVLSQAARLFDPLGWLAPVVVRAKILFQGTWLQGLDWDTPLDSSDAAQWTSFLEELPGLVKIRVPRWLRCSSTSDDIELHGFADASERAYAAVVYLRTINKEINGWTTALVTAKTRVSPLKQISLPRLELCAATLLVRLMTQVRTVLDMEKRATHLWSDSTVVLGWIQGHPSRWKTFVANRVSEIQTTLPLAQWHHVASGDNPADCASRGMSPRELAQHSLWWCGPPWLKTTTAFSETCRLNVTEAGDELLEARKQMCGNMVQDEEPELLTRYSNLTRLLRITAWCRRWLKGAVRSNTPPTAEEMDRGLLAWIRWTQARTYTAEITQLSRGETLSRRSSLLRLTPFLDAEGTLRVGGRLQHSLLAYDEKHPIILPRSSRLTTLLIDACHARILHGGVQQTLGLLRQRYWVPGGRTAVRSHIHRCLRCLRWRAESPQQLMGSLPKSRVTPARPFQHTGVDYAGPVLLRTTKGRGHKAHKAFLAIFICLSTRAVHLEVVSDYTAEAFLAALRRFTSRRGLPQELVSDCGTNFTGAEAELRALFTASNQEAQRIGRALATERIRWRFNPPAAPHFGGIWEAAVKAVKHHLRRVVGNSTLTFEEMTTFLTQVEACLNSRPIAPLSDDPDDLAALTPGHFLVGTALLAVPEPTLVDVSTSRLTRWQHVQQMRDHFWRRWSQECLHRLAERPKWQAATENPRVGQLCLVRSEITPPARWPLARITALHPGDDGRVRVVEVRTATSRLTRPLTKIVFLPVEPHTDGNDAQDTAGH